jgi:hypothetical protein
VRTVKLRAWIRRFKRWRTEHWIAFASATVAACSMVIALCSLIVSVYGAYLTRRHDRLSVRPVFILSYYFNETGNGWHFNNIGLGPARIRGFKVFVDGIPQKPEPLFANVITRAFNLEPGSKIQFINLYAGESVPVGHDEALVWLPPGPAADKVFAGFQRIKFEVCYCSIYDECWRYTITRATPVEGTRDDSCSTFSGDPPSIWWEP